MLFPSNDVQEVARKVNAYTSEAQVIRGKNRRLIG